ncbi:armadillo-type protein [Cunninghamella echinulata]|nr:armadillo-type protein [Cunninghamella echinulata]
MSDPRSQLLAVLTEAASQDVNRIKQAEELLKQWEIAPSFFATLQNIFYDTTIDHNVRFLSGIYLKNGIERFWRRTAKNPISAEEKIEIRNRLLQFMNEPSKLLSAQNTIIIARIARIDFPLQWPDLIESLLHGIESSTNNEGAALIHHRCLETLYEVLNELSSRVLASGRRQFAELAPRTFQVIANVYMIYVNQSLTSLEQHQMADINSLEVVTLCIRCLGVLMVSGIPLKESIEAVIDKYGSMYLSLQQTHPVSVALCPRWIEILLYYWGIVIDQSNIASKQLDEGNTEIYQKIILQGMQLVKGTIKNNAYDSSAPGNTYIIIENTRQIICENFITGDFVHSCAEVMVSKYMLLTPSDLEQWETDPEGWANSVDAENWEFELRPCAEAIFISLLAQHRDQLTPIILNLLERPDAQDFQGLLFKDSIYNAVGLGVHSLYGRLDFEVFVINKLVNEIKNKDLSYKILRRRIAWLLGRWVTESISADCRIAIYEILLQLMVKEEDLVVRLSAAHSLKLAIDDWDFDISILLPYLGTAMDLLLPLINEVDESDTVMKLISDLNTIMDRAGEHIVKEQSNQLYPLFLPMIAYSVNRNNEAHVYLLEEALDLWWTLLQCANGLTNELVELLPEAVGLLDYDTENVKKVLWIIESYILLDPQVVVQSCGLSLFTHLVSFISNSRSDVASNISNTIELVLRSASMPLYGEPLFQSGLLNSILEVFLSDKLYAYASMSYMSLFARLAIHDANTAINFIQSTGQTINPGSNDFFGEVIDKWMDKFDNIGHPRQRKLTCLGFTYMLRTNNPSIMKRLPALMAIWSDVGLEVKESDGER